MDTRQYIEEGRAVLGIELGSTRIKAVLIDGEGKILAKGGFDWENHLVDGIWTYSLPEVWQGLQSCYRDLTKWVQKEYGVTLKKLSALGISGMMHGYMPFDREGQLLTPFRTWRNNITGPAARELTELFRYNIPQRWSVAHLYQAILNGEEPVKDVDYITTLSAYVHWQLTGQRVLGVGDASGMFPIDIDRQDYRQDMLDAFDRLVAPKGYPWKLRQILPRVLTAGQPAGCLTAEGAALLDPLGNLEPGVPLCPPEGDAGTGMVATNCIRERRGNVSAGTSAFAMLVLEKELSRVYTQLDMVTTPAGKLVAMAHSQNCTSAINDWVGLLGETLEAFGLQADEGRLYETLFLKAKEGDADCGGLLPYCFYSGEHGVELTKGMPMVMHPANARFNLANFMRAQLYTCFGAMKLGMDILVKEEKAAMDQMLGHGGIFKTPGVAQGILAAALNVPVAVMETAGEGGAWGIALLAAYLGRACAGCTLEDYLDGTVFKDSPMTVMQPAPEEVKGYEAFMERYKKGLAAERAAVKCLL